MQISNAIESFFESLGPLGLFLYSILETVSLFPITEILLLPLSTNQPASTVFWLATVASLGVVEIGRAHV
jgi:membrane protein YqaA with SNARE-associated domain